jgi:co-chaperonin GroES (HSP10)
MEGTGVRIGNETNTFVAAEAHIRPLRDQIIVEPLDWKPSKIILIAGDKRKPLRGIVRAVGPGIYPKQYDGPKGRRTKSWDSKHFRPCDVKVGDTVELGGLEIGGYLFQTFMWGHTEMVICREADVAVIVESEAA